MPELRSHIIHGNRGMVLLDCDARVMRLDRVEKIA